MKKSAFLVTLLTSILFISCSSDDSGTGSNFETPLTIGNYWTYDVEGQAGITRDSLYISNDTVIGSNTYKKFKTENNIATGFYSSALRNNGVRESNGKLKLSGDLSLASGQTLPIAVDLTLSDFVIFNKNASNNQALNSSPKTGTIQQTVSGYPLNINYSLQSYGGETLTSFTSPNGDVYTDVKTTKIKLNVEITTTISGFPITALAAQDVLVSTQYLADGIGVVYTNTVTSYSLNSLVATQLGIPATSSQTQEEFLDTYLVN
ncbi:hypothetical protein [Flavobacterium celericrescens]|uniref:Lipoprotein n=1 Tax=Flavobacterium celericrescens TaxID=2709780 RepID=A0ABX0I956_9FLAO|nr:hypothetical protein [Flavobacterium celericrescens]NHM03713.1 hypothetical protein [Flavobacterium celericrescens]